MQKRTAAIALTLRQRTLPLPGGWTGDHDLGVITAPAARAKAKTLLRKYGARFVQSHSYPVRAS